MQVFVPVYDVALAQDLALKLWDFSHSTQKSEFERVVDLALACMLFDQGGTEAAGGETVGGGAGAAGGAGEWALEWLGRMFGGWSGRVGVGKSRRLVTDGGRSQTFQNVVVLSKSGVGLCDSLSSM